MAKRKEKLEIGRLVESPSSMLLMKVVNIGRDTVTLQDAFGRIHKRKEVDCIPSKNGAGQRYADGRK